MTGDELRDFDEHVRLARTLLSNGESDADLWQANQHVNLALMMRPNEPAAWILKSQVMSTLEDDMAALAAVEMALQRQPTSAEANYVRAAVLADTERYPEALRGLERAFSCITATDQWLVEDLYYEKAAILDAMDRTDEAEQTFQAGLRRCPDSALLRSGLEPLQRERVRRTLRVIDGGQR